MRNSIHKINPHIPSLQMRALFPEEEGIRLPTISFFFSFFFIGVAAVVSQELSVCRVFTDECHRWPFSFTWCHLMTELTPLFSFIPTVIALAQPLWLQSWSRSTHFVAHKLSGSFIKALIWPTSSPGPSAWEAPDEPWGRGCNWKPLTSKRAGTYAGSHLCKNFRYESGTTCSPFNWIKCLILDFCLIPQIHSWVAWGDVLKSKTAKIKSCRHFVSLYP